MATYYPVRLSRCFNIRLIPTTWKSGGDLEAKAAGIRWRSSSVTGSRRQRRHMRGPHSHSRMILPEIGLYEL